MNKDARSAGLPADEALMEAYAKGDPAAFEQLFARWRDRLYGYFARAFEPGTAEDLFQKAWLLLHRARRDYTPGRSFPPWLFAIAANARREEWRRRGRRPEEPQAAPDPGGHASSAEDGLIEEERRRALHRAVAALPEAQREVIELHRFEGMSFPEIAEALGEHVEAVKSRAFRAYKTLREALEEVAP